MSDDPLQDVIDIDDTDNIFLSTQIQSNLDELEEDEKKRQVSHQIFLEYSHKSDANGKLLPSNDKLTQSKKNAKQVKPKKTTSRLPRKKKSKAGSVTDQMINKLSGQPHKLKQMSLRLQKDTLGVNKNLPNGFPGESEGRYESIFSEMEWKLINSRRRTVAKERIQDPVITGTTLHENLWQSAADTPVLTEDDWALLYDKSQDDCSWFNQNLNHEGPVTLSQIIKDSINFTTNNIPSSMHEVIEIDSSSEEIECSSPEGSSFGFSNIFNPIDHSCSNYVKYKGPVHHIRPSHRDFGRFDYDRESSLIDEIPGSSEEEGDISNYIQIIHRRS